MTADASPHFEPGPSFVDDEPLQVNPTELPPWLRDLAATNPPTVEEPPIAEPEEKLPDWLRATRSLATEPVAAAVHEPTPVEPLTLGDEFSFIGDDDLPEWLRALGDEEPAASATTGPEMSAVRGAAPAAVLDVPSISRAWLTTLRPTDPDLEAAARPDFFPADAELAGAPAMQTAETMVPEVEPEPVPSTMVSRTSAVGDRKRRIRLLLLILSILVILAAVYYLAGLPR